MTAPTIARKERDPGRWLALAASPGLALMALVSALDPPVPDFCGGAMTLPIDRMTAMYLLMAVFHLPPWLKLAARRAPDLGARS